MKRKQESVVSYDPDSTSIVLDSRFRTGTDEPSSFEATLTSSIRGRKFFHQALSWSQSLFTHNLTNNEIRLRIENNDHGDDIVYYGYLPPWIIYNEIDGNYDSGFFEDPQPGSYAYELEFSLNHLRRGPDLLLLNQPTVGASTVVFKVNYLKGRGLCITATDSTLPTPNFVGFVFENCNWIEKGHFIHGYGVYNTSLKMFTPNQTDFSHVQYGQNPLLCYTRFVTITCPEISRNRTYPSIDNSNNNPFLCFELGVYQIIPEKIGVFYTQKTSNDETVIPLKAGEEAQSIRISVLDEDGEQLICGDPLSKFAADVTVPAYIRRQYLTGETTSNAINQLMFGEATGDTDPGEIMGTLFPNIPTIIEGTLTFDAYMVDMIFNPNQTFIEYSSLCPFLPSLTNPGLFYLNTRYKERLEKIFITIDIPITTYNQQATDGALSAHLGLRPPNSVAYADLLFDQFTPGVIYVTWNNSLVANGNALKFSFEYTGKYLLGALLQLQGAPFMLSLFIQQTEIPLINYTLDMANATMRIRPVWFNLNTSKIFEPDGINETYGKTNLKMLCDEIIHSIKVELE